MAHDHITVGLAALSAQWFADVGLFKESNTLGALLRGDYARVTATLEAHCGAVVAPGVICSPEDAARAMAKFAAAGVDAIVLVHMMWNEDQQLAEILARAGDRPVLLWNFLPEGRMPAKLSVDDLLRFSGTVGMLQGSAVLQQRGCRPEIVTGAPDDPILAEQLREFFTALRIRAAFRGMKAGRIAGRCECMHGTYIYADRLRDRLGVELVEIDTPSYAEACTAVSAVRIDDFCADLTARYPVAGVSSASLRLAARNTLALDDLVVLHDLRAAAIQDTDETLHRLVGVRPCLCPPESARRGVPFAMEADLNIALGMFAAMRATGGPCMYTEVYTFDPVENLLLMGHAGVHDPRLAAGNDVTLVPDMEYRNSDVCEGAWQEFILADGPITAISLYDTGDHYRMTVFEGRSLGGARRLEGFAHALIRPDVPVTTLLPRLVARGLTQHFAVVPGHLVATLTRWCRMSGVECCVENV